MGVIVFILSSVVVSFRLLLLFARLRQPPELFLGLAYLIAGALGWGGLLVGAVTTPPGKSLPEAISAWSVITGNVGSLCLYLFTWYVFRRESKVAKLPVALAPVGFAVSLVHNTFINHLTYGPPPGTPTVWLGMFGRTIVYAWTATEAFLAYAAFRRRARIALGNPLVANRLFLWGVASVPSLLLSIVAVTLYVTAANGVQATSRHADAGSFYGACALITAITQWLAFFPPKAYVRWIERNAANDASDDAERVDG